MGDFVLRELYQDAARLYRHAGDNATATVMDDLHSATLRPDADQVDLGRGATTLAHNSVSELYTIDPPEGRSGRR